MRALGATLIVLGTACGAVVDEIDRYSIDVTSSGPGTVEFLDQVCPNDCSAEVDERSNILLVAIPTADATFQSWSVEGCGTAPTCRVLVEDNTSITASFVWPERTLTVTATGSGRIVGPDEFDCSEDCTADFPHGTIVELSAVPDAGSELAEWADDCSASSGSICMLEMSRDRSVGARFMRTTRSLEVSLVGTGQSYGRVESTDGAIDCPGRCTASYLDGDQVVLAVRPNPRARFDGWSGDCSGVAECRITLSGNTDVAALFTDITVPIQVTLEGSGRGVVTSTPIGISCGVDCTAHFVPDTRVTLFQAPASGSRFHAWGGACASSARATSCELTTDASRSVAAIFHENQVLDVAFGLGHTCALVAPSFVRCFGLGDDGQLGYGDTTSRGDGVGPAANAADVPIADVTAIGAGHWHTCAIRGGQVSCWGRNDDGQLGTGAAGAGANPNPLGPIDFGAGAVATAVVGGAWHTCALVDGAVRCWGRGANGQLGYGDPNTRPSPGPAVPLVGAGTVTQLSSGGIHTCVLKDPGVIRCWGSNSNGQLGQGHTNPRGNDAGSIADVDLGGALVAQLSAGGSHTCVRIVDGTVRCWGRNLEGQLGLGDTIDRGTDPTHLPITEAVTLPAPATDIAAGNSHTCARLVDGRVYCWGWALYAQLGHGDAINRGDGIGPAANAAPTPLGVSADRVFAGATNHTCITHTDGLLRCWGNGTSGQLGVGDRENRGDGSGAPPSAGDVPVF